MQTELSPSQWRIICSGLASGACVPFLGAGANVSSNGYRGLPLSDAVALHLVGKLINEDVKTVEELADVRTLKPALHGYGDLMRLGLQDLSRVALHLSENERDLIDALKEMLPETHCEPSPLLDLLARMTEVKLIVTTNYDGLMERALEKYGRRYKQVVQPKKGFDLDRHRQLDDELLEWDGLVLYKLHGSFSEAGDIIVTEEDYIQFLTVAASEERGVPRLIQGTLKDSVLLFLGYGLQDWDFRTIYKALIEKLRRHESRHSFAIQLNPTYFWFKYWLTKDVEIFNADLYEFVGNLEREYASSYQLLPKQPAGDG